MDNHVSGLFTLLSSVSLLALVAGLIRPQLLGRWIQNPTRKRIFWPLLFVLCLTAGIADYTKAPAQRAAEKARRQALQSAQHHAAPDSPSNISPPFPDEVANKLCSTVTTYVSGILGSKMHGEQIDVRRYAARIASEDLAGLPTRYRAYEEKLLLHFGTGMEHDPNPAETIQKYTANPTGFLAALMTACTGRLTSTQ